MQGQSQAPIPQWLYYVLSNLATFIAFGTGWYRERQNRKKLEAEIKLQFSQMHLSDAQTRLTDAQVESTQLTTRKSAIEIIDGCYTRIDALELQVDDLKSKNRQLETVIGINEKQLSNLKCVLDLHGINYGDVLDEIKGVKHDPLKLE